MRNGGLKKCTKEGMKKGGNEERNGGMKGRMKEGMKGGRNEE